MFPLFESIKLLDGSFFHLDLHQERMDESLLQIFGHKNIHNLQSIVQNQKFPQKGLFKYRLAYGLEKFKIEIIPYQSKKIKTLRIVSCDDINYELKFSDRKKFNFLLKKNSDVDEILILKNGLLSDSSYSNIVLWNGEEWQTPRKPLLKGIQRKFLLSQNKIKVAEIGVSELDKYEKIGLINAMMDFEDMSVIEVENIQY